MVAIIAAGLRLAASSNWLVELGGIPWTYSIPAGTKKGAVATGQIRLFGLVVNEDSLWPCQARRSHGDFIRSPGGRDVGFERIGRDLRSIRHNLELAKSAQ